MQVCRGLAGHTAQAHCLTNSHCAAIGEPVDMLLACLRTFQDSISLRRRSTFNSTCVWHAAIHNNTDQGGLQRSTLTCLMYAVVHAVVDRAARSRRRHAHTVQAATPSSASQSSPQVAKPRLVLGIESSCDDTGAAVVTSDGRVLGESLASQADIHAPWGGVVPNLAMDAHKDAIDRVVHEALAKAGVKETDLDAVAVTVGPGLGLCLRVGAIKAHQISARHQLPLIKVHHMEAHALVARMTQDIDHQPQYPFICLLVSGGHNLLVLVKGVGQYVQLGTTLDDALGEAYDKIARLLGLDLRPSGGAALEAIAKEGDPQAFKFVVPMRRYNNCDFSYAGLKTSVRLAIEAKLGLDSGTTALGNYHTAKAAEEAAAAVGSVDVSVGQDVPTQPMEAHEAGHAGMDGAVGEQEDANRRKLKADIAASFQHSATLHLIERVKRAIAWARETDPDVRHLVVAGGVACNMHIRSSLQQVASDSGLTLVLPPPRWCTDNGAMVAWAGHERIQLGLHQAPADPAVYAEADDSTWVDLWPRWPLTSTKHPKCTLPEATAPHNRKTVDGGQYGARSARRARIQVSLTDMTAEELLGKGNMEGEGKPLVAGSTGVAQ